MNENLVPNLHAYAIARQLRIGEPLGSGKDGIVLVGAHLDGRPEFSAEIWTDWEAEKREQFEGRWAEVEKALAAFEELGVYLLDVSPGNIGFLD